MYVPCSLLTRAVECIVCKSDGVFLGGGGGRIDLCMYVVASGVAALFSVCGNNR